MRLNCTSGLMMGLPICCMRLTGCMGTAYCLIILKKLVPFCGFGFWSDFSNNASYLMNPALGFTYRLFYLTLHSAFSRFKLYFLIKYITSNETDLLIPMKQCMKTLVCFLCLSMNSNAASACYVMS